jgi:hypothetical protein
LIPLSHIGRRSKTREIQYKSKSYNSFKRFHEMMEQEAARTLRNSHWIVKERAIKPVSLCRNGARYKAWLYDDRSETLISNPNVKP